MIFNGFIGFISSRVKRCFRPGTLSFLLMLFTALPSFAAPEKVQSARKQVTAAVQHHAAQALRQEAGRRRWPVPGEDEPVYPFRRLPVRSLP